jgi:hypothetical protein
MPNKELVHLRTMAYCLHSHVLLLSNDNTQCKMKLMRLRMRGLTTTYDVVVAVVLLLLPLRAIGYKIIKLVRLRTMANE